MLSGFTFQFSDGWWKYGKQNLDIHDNNASWFNGGYFGRKERITT
jgi:hypothetical protein